jgi:hypothetical protein
MEEKAYVIIAQYYGKSFISKLIKWRTWSDVSHTAALTPDEKWVYEAWHKNGVIKSKWEEQPHTPGTKVVLYKLYCTEQEAKRFYGYLEAQLGKKYDFKAIVGFVLRIPIEGFVELFCSQYVFNGTLSMGKKILKRIESFKVSPGMIELSPELHFYKTVKTP